MKLIPLDTVLEVLTKVSTRSHIPNVIDAVMEIPTIDPIATIDKMIEEELKDNQEYTAYTLKELKSRILLAQKEYPGRLVTPSGVIN